MIRQFMDEMHQTIDVRFANVFLSLDIKKPTRAKFIAVKINGEKKVSSIKTVVDFAKATMIEC